jgi:hypothetical protein
MEGRGRSQGSLEDSKWSSGWSIYQITITLMRINLLKSWIRIQVLSDKPDPDPLLKGKAGSGSALK